ncbi:MAG: hypothetical protein ACRC9P_01690, partial [Bacteroides sp.]
KGRCKLYETDGEILKSHIFPKFIIEYMRNTGSKYLRNFSQPNRRLQDGPKGYLLSPRAEQEFSVREKWFAENIFLPYLQEKRPKPEYDENLFYFSVSLLWRVLLIQMEDGNIHKLPFFSLLKEAEREWKFFLREYKFPRKHNRFYLFFTDRIKSHNLNIEGVDFYMTRALDATIVSNKDGSFVAVYAKFLRFVFWAILKGGDEDKISDLRIDPIKGEFKIPQRLEDETICGFFVNRIMEIENLPKPSISQQSKIEDEILKDKNRFINSDAGQSIMNDNKMKL